VSIVLSLFVGAAYAILATERVEGLIEQRSVVFALGQETAVRLGTSRTAVVGVHHLIGVLNHFYHVLTIPSWTLVSH
jgi:hypothetical protein